MITGSSPREVNFNQGETLSQLIERLAGSSDLPLRKVSSWYADNTPVASAKTLVLRNGMKLMGAPKVDGGNA
jgi:hypothetical protein